MWFGFYLNLFCDWIPLLFGSLLAIWCWSCPVLSCPVLCSQRVNGAVCEYSLPAGLGAGAGEAVWDAEPSSGGGAEVMCWYPAPPPPRHAGNTEQTLAYSPPHTYIFHRPISWTHPRSERVHSIVISIVIPIASLSTGWMATNPRTSLAIQIPPRWVLIQLDSWSVLEFNAHWCGSGKFSPVCNLKEPT